MDRTNQKIDTQLAREGSRPVRFEIVSYRGEIFGPYPSMGAAVQAALEKWPDQEQDEDRTGKGWDVQSVGAE